MAVARLETVWSVTGGGAGLTVMHGIVDELDYDATDAQASLTAIRTFFSTIASRLPNDAALSWPGPVDIFSEAGVLIGSVAPTASPSSVTGGSAAAYSAPSGARVDWETGVITGGKRIRGRSYIVPIAGDQYDADGTIATDFITSVNTAANTMRTSLATAGSPLAVWSRKNSEATAVQGQTVKDKAAILRSRRD